MLCLCSSMQVIRVSSSLLELIKGPVRIEMSMILEGQRFVGESKHTVPSSLMSFYCKLQSSCNGVCGKEASLRLRARLPSTSSAHLAIGKMMLYYCALFSTPSFVFSKTKALLAVSKGNFHRQQRLEFVQTSRVHVCTAMCML